MTNAQIRLLFAGVFTITSIGCALIVALVCIAKGYTPEATLALLGPFAVVTSSGVTFFLGHQNGISEVNERGGSEATKLIVDAAAEATKLVASAAATATRVAAEAATRREAS